MQKDYVYLNHNSKISIELNSDEIWEIKIGDEIMCQAANPYPPNSVYNRLYKLLELLKRHKHKQHSIRVYRKKDWGVNGFWGHLEELYRNNKRWLEPN